MKAVLRALARSAKRRQTRRELHSLSDQELRDIGIGRGQIEEIVKTVT